MVSSKKYQNHQNEPSEPDGRFESLKLGVQEREENGVKKKYTPKIIEKKCLAPCQIILDWKFSNKIFPITLVCSLSQSLNFSNF